jgi:hypothetical protein
MVRQAFKMSPSIPRFTASEGEERECFAFFQLLARLFIQIGGHGASQADSPAAPLTMKVTFLPFCQWVNWLFSLLRELLI